MPTRLRRILNIVRALLGIELTPTNHPEKLISAAGGFIGLLLVSLVSSRLLGPSSAVLVVASMGASAVLLFAAPHGALSQPWPLLGGHLLSAAVGVTCFRFVPDVRMAAPASVGLAIGVMYYARCIHPPGGATALTAVLGGPAVQSLGYAYVVTPVLLNTVILLAVAVAVNAPFSWRRYPSALIRRRPMRRPGAISHDHLSFALSKMGSLIDVTEEDLAEIYTLAAQHAQGTHLDPEEIRVGGCYSNRRDDPRWRFGRWSTRCPPRREIRTWCFTGYWPATTGAGPERVRVRRWPCGRTKKCRPHKARWNLWRQWREARFENRVVRT